MHSWSISRKGRHGYRANEKNALTRIRNAGDLNNSQILCLTNTNQALNYMISSTVRAEYFKTLKSSGRIQFSYFARTFVLLAVRNT